MSSLIIEICKIENIIKHPNADKLSIATVKGWNCIVGLDQYKINDLVVYCPPDSIIPNNLIEKYNLEYLKKNGRVGTVKLRGYISQGLILDLPDGNFKEGDDVADLLSITKYEPPAPPAMRGAKQIPKRKMNPLFDKYTDIENIKNYNDVFKDGDNIVITEKIHGSNSRFGNLEIVIDKHQPFIYKIQNWFTKNILKHTHQWVYGSHNVQISGNTNRNSYYGDDVWGKIAKKYNMKDIIPEDYIVYGEIYGYDEISDMEIQDLHYGKNEIDLIIFDVKYKDKYLSWEELEIFCHDRNLPLVPLLYLGGYYDGVIQTYTNGKSSLCPSQIKEGCVIKSLEEENNPRIGRKILKSINPDYLIRKNATEYQ